MQPENIFAIFFTFEVSNFDRLKEVKDLQSVNIPSIFSTFEVSKFDKSI